MLKNIRQMVGAGLIACGSTVYATSTWIGGHEGGWANPDNWDGGVPAAHSDVSVSSGVNLPVNDADALLAGSVSEIVLSGSDSTVTFELVDSPCALSGKISGKGTIIKNGTNTLSFLSKGVNDYYVVGGIQLNAGIIQCPTDFPPAYSTQGMFFGPLYIAEGAEFRPCAFYATTEVSSLTGRGKVYNYKSGSNDGWPFLIASSKNSVFDGTIGGYLFLKVNAPIDFTGSASSYVGEFSITGDRADVGVAKFGCGNENTSLGKTYWDSKKRPLNYFASGRLRYLGEGETTDRNIKIGGNVAGELDAGATGGLVCSGKVFSEASGNAIFTLSGSNGVESALTGGWDDGVGSTYLAKSGTGAWRLVGHADRRNKGVVAVEGGTLVIDSLAETNEPCSLGLSTSLYEKYAGANDDSRKADYAVLLGSAESEGTLEYDGSNFWESANATATRPIAVTGRGGRIRVSGANRRVGFKGAFAADAAGSSLTLDGDASTNCFYDITDRHGELSVIKEGTGTWVLGGNQTFSGKLDVKGGELVVSSLMGRSYTWYRYTVCQSYYGAIHDPATAPVANNSSVRMREFAIFDVDGNRLNGGYSGVSQLTVPSEKEVSGWALNAVVPAATCTGLTDGSIADTVNVNVVIDGVRTPPTWNDPRTWIPFVFRMPVGTVSADSYDIVSSESNTHVWEPSGFKMEASADGVFWDLVSSVESNTTAYAAKYWLKSGKSATNLNAHKGFPFGLDKGKSLLSEVPVQLTKATVSVSSGATLRAEGRVSIQGLEIDVANAGIVDGFAFAENGTVNLLGIDRLATSAVLPLVVKNLQSVENFANGWTVSVKGRAKKGARLSYENGRLTVHPSGMVIVVQ